MNTSDEKKFAKLSNGQRIPRIGYGTGGGGANPKAEEETEALVKEAVKIGYRHIDTATIYNTEKAIGRALKQVISDGIVKREDLFITTKVGSNDDKGNIERAVKESLEKLQLDYIDLYLIHWPIGEVDPATGKVKKQVPLHVTWKAMEDQVKAGRIKSIGVSNFNVQLLLDLLSYAEIKPVCNQVEVHPYLIQEDLIGFCKKNDIEITAYSPLGGTFQGGKFTAKSLMEDETIKELSTKYNKTPGQIILNWHLSRGYVAIPKTLTIARLEENLQADSFNLSEEDIKKVSALNKNMKIYDLKNYKQQGNIPIFA